MRLIDADALISANPKSIIVYNAVEKAPTVEAVPVVRCKDCKYFDDDINYFFPYCEKKDRDTDYNEFCSYGVRKESKNENL